MSHRPLTRKIFVDAFILIALGIVLIMIGVLTRNWSKWGWADYSHYFDFGGYSTHTMLMKWKGRNWTANSYFVLAAINIVFGVWKLVS